MAAGREKFLRVAEAKPADAGRGIVRIDPEVMKILDLKEGDIVLIEGAKSTAAGVRRGYPEDANRGVIRMDGMQRRNAGVGIDDKVGLRKALARPAEKVSLAPTEPIRIMRGEQYMAQVLQGRAITRGDVISVSVMGRKFDFVVTSFSPGADAVLVEAETEIKIAEKPMKEEEAKVPKVDYEDIGGLGSEVRKVREMIELPLRHPELFERLGVEAPKGVLLHGPPGCIVGDSLIALENGGLIRIEELAKGVLPGVYIADLPIYPPGSAKALHVYDVPETMEMITETGKRLRTTLNHPLMTNTGGLRRRNSSP